VRSHEQAGTGYYFDGEQPLEEPKNRADDVRAASPDFAS
jgi:hypothetical protein